MHSLLFEYRSLLLDSLENHFEEWFSKPLLKLFTALSLRESLFF